MPTVAPFLSGLLAAALLTVSATSWAQARSGDATSPTRMKSGAMVGLGIASTVVGAAEGVLGTVLVVNDIDNGPFDRMSNFEGIMGTIVLVDAGIHLAVGIPLIVVGAQREPTDAGDKDGIDTAEVSVRGSEVVASFTF